MIREGKKYNAIILAAGNSERMGQPKLFLPFDKNHTFLDMSILAFNQFGCVEIVVVINKNIASIQNTSSDYTMENVHYCVNPNPEEGRFSSIQIGIRQLNQHLPLFIHNVDNPFVTKETLTKLSQNFLLDYARPVFNGKGGHPVLLSEKLSTMIGQEVLPDKNFKTFLLPFRRQNIVVHDKRVLANINSPEDYMVWFGSDLIKISNTVFNHHSLP